MAPETQKFTRADTGLLIVSIVVGDEDWRRRMEDDGSEKGLEFAGSVCGEPRREGNLLRGLGWRGLLGCRRWIGIHCIRRQGVR